MPDDIYRGQTTGADELMCIEVLPMAGYSDFDQSIGIAMGVGSWGLDPFAPDHHERTGDT